MVVVVVKEAIVLVADTGAVAIVHHQVVAWTCCNSARRVVALRVVCVGRSIRARK